MKVNFNRVGAGAIALLLSAGFLVSGGCASSKVLEQRPYIPAPGETDSSLAVEPTAPDAQIKNAQVNVEAVNQPIDVSKPVIPDNPSPLVAPAPTGPVQINKTQPSNGSLQQVYTVQKGDSLWKIGHKFGMSASELASYNGFPETKSLMVGQSIRIPASAKSTGKGHVLATVAPEVTTSSTLPVSHAAAPTAAVAPTEYPPFVPKKTSPIMSKTSTKGEKKSSKSSKSAKTAKSAKSAKAEKGVKAEKTEAVETIEGETAEKESGKAEASTYTVQKGDFWAKIAKKLKVSSSDLAAANNKKVSDKLHVGQKLVVPGKKGGKGTKEAKGAKEETDSMLGDLSTETSAVEATETGKKGGKKAKDAKTEKVDATTEGESAMIEPTGAAAGAAKTEVATPKAEKADAGVELDADVVKTRNVEVSEDCTIEQFAAKHGVKPEEVKKHNPGTEGKLQKGDIITIPE